MTKILWFIALILVVWWLWRKTRNPGTDAVDPPAQGEAERMVQCAYCGVNQPVSESLLDQGRYYCCATHLRATRSVDR